MIALITILATIVLALSGALFFLYREYKEVKTQLKCAVADLIGNVAEFRKLEDKIQQLESNNK